MLWSCHFPFSVRVTRFIYGRNTANNSTLHQKFPIQKANSDATDAACKELWLHQVLPKTAWKVIFPIGCVGLGSSFDSGRTKNKKHPLQVLELDVQKQKQKQKGALADRTPDPAMTCGIETAIACSTTELKLQIYRTHPCAISARFWLGYVYDSSRSFFIWVSTTYFPIQRGPWPEWMFTVIWGFRASHNDLWKQRRAASAEMSQICSFRLLHDLKLSHDQE